MSQESSGTFPALASANALLQNGMAKVWSIKTRSRKLRCISKLHAELSPASLDRAFVSSRLTALRGHLETSLVTAEFSAQ
jgi:hypothetical protein